MAPTKSPSLQRFEFFTDGVLAIIVTIMAIELKIPDLGGHLGGAWDFRFLVSELPKLLSYALGFFMISTGWVAHLLMARDLERTNIQLITANLVYLFMASLLPAVTAFVGDYPTLPKAVFLWSAVAGTVLIWGGQVMVRAARSAGLARTIWAERRNNWAAAVAVIAVVSSLVSIYVPVALMFVSYALHWIPLRQATWLFGSAAAIALPELENANRPSKTGSRSKKARNPTRLKREPAT